MAPVGERSRGTERVFGAHRPERRPEVIARPSDGARLRWAPDVLHVVAPIQTRGGQEGTLAMGFSLAELRSERQTTLFVVGAAVGLVLIGGGIVAWLLAHNLDRRRAAEAAQRRSEESFRALIETLQPGAGSLFEVRLPPRPADLPTNGAAPAAIPQSPVAGGTPRVLVVDDEPRIAVSISRLFAREMHIHGEDSARRALARLGDEPMFDAVVCDLMMPEMGGVELYEQINNRWPLLARRVVFPTGGAFTPEAAAFLETVPNPVISKPFDPDELRAAIEGIVRRNSEPAATASVDT